jgi:hypothetical protein
MNRRPDWARRDWREAVVVTTVTVLAAAAIATVFVMALMTGGR